LTRQNVPTLDRSNSFSSADGLSKGAYVLADLGSGDPEIILMASGSEVSLIIEAGQKLADAGRNVRLVSFPSWDLFEAQPEDYQKKVLPDSIAKRISVEAGITMGWEKWIGSQGISIGMTGFGASAPANTLYKQFGITADAVLQAAENSLKK